MLVRERCVVDRQRIGIGHLHEARDAARCSSTGLRGEVALVHEAGFAEVHLIVDHAGEHELAGSVQDLVCTAMCQVAADLGNAAVNDE